jgi:NADPH:quinone reductase-like Zn-dependent oxidoreductase
MVMMNESNTMQAIRYHAYGGPEQLVFERVPRPELKPGTVLVRVKAAGVNPWDWKLRMGAYRQFMPIDFPYTPGIELAGVIEEIGPEVSGFGRGQAVYGSASGTNAEYAVAPASSLAPKPAALTFDQAAAVAVGATTAWRALFDAAGLQAGQRLLIQGAAGGVGSFAVQLARWRGAHVIGTASARNLDFVRSLGAEEVIDYQATPVERAVHDVDVVLDTVGGDVEERSLQVLRPGGVFVTVAGQPPEEKAQARGVRAAGVGQGDPARTGELLRQIEDLIESGQIKVQVTNVFPLAQAGQAHALSQTGHGQGRIVLHVAD